MEFKDVEKLQKTIQKLTEKDLQALIDTFPPKSQDIKFRNLNEASRYLQMAVNMLSKVIENF